MTDLVEKSAPTITSFGAAVTKGKIGGEGQEVEEMISGIIRNWKHLVRGTLLEVLKDFGTATRASANMLVSWTGDFTVVHDVFDAIEELVFGKERERKRQWWRQWRKKLGLTKG
jgi:hypothetical protein